MPAWAKFCQVAPLPWPEHPDGEITCVLYAAHRGRHSGMRWSDDQGEHNVEWSDTEIETTWRRPRAIPQLDIPTRPV